jgi:hypothetical protein
MINLAIQRVACTQTCRTRVLTEWKLHTFLTRLFNGLHPNNARDKSYVNYFSRWHFMYMHTCQPILRLHHGQLCTTLTFYLLGKLCLE